MIFVFEAHRITAELMDNDSARKGLIADFNVESPVSAVQGVFLDEVQIFYTGNLHE